MLVRKRNGKEVTFDIKKIEFVIDKAKDANFKGVTTAELAYMATKALPNDYVIDIEDIQDAILITLAHHDVNSAVAFARYRTLHAKKRNQLIDPVTTIEEYLEKGDWRVKENSNQNFCYGGLVNNTVGKVFANYWLDKVFSEEAGQYHRNGDVHIHDLGTLATYCTGYSLRELLYYGFNGVKKNIAAKPPKHLSAALGQMANFFGAMQNEQAGAVSFSSVDTFLAPYIRNDSLSFKDVKQEVQEFVFAMNVNNRWGAQTVFSNITFDDVCPEDLTGLNPVIGGKNVYYTYGDLQREIDMIGRAFFEVFKEGDANGVPFTFPIPTINVTNDFQWDSPKNDLIFEVTAKYGTPYFSNFVNSDMKPNMVRSMCCRLRLDLAQLEMRGNGLFGAGEKTGSLGVYTVNMARIGYVHKGDKGLTKVYQRLEELLEVGKDTLEKKREFLKKHLKKGLYPYTKKFLGSFKNHFSTIGINGVNEFVLNFTDGEYDITDPRGKQMALDILDFIRERLVVFQEETGHMYNLEATPAEGATYRFAMEDIKRYPDIIQAGTDDNPYYTNSTQAPVDFTDDPYEMLEHQDALQVKYTGGTVQHLYTGQKMTGGQVKELIRKACTKFKLPYLTISPIFSICPTHGHINGEHETCPDCGSPCVVMTRVMGYFRPIESFNPGKQSEFNERVELKL